VQTVDLSPSTGIYCHVVPAGVWQAAQPLDAEILAGCSVAPGFEFSGFTLLAPATKTARALLASAPDLEFLTRPCA
jgi:predicted cupin superfamily sugar epimerase